MIIVGKETLKFLLNGRQVVARVESGAYRRNRTYAVGVRHNKTVCRVRVIKVVDSGDGVDELTIARVSGDEVKLFTRSGGYVRAPVEADPMDPDVLRGADFTEPEAVDDETQAKLTELGTMRWRQEHALREAQRVTAEMHERLAALEHAAKRPGAPDVSGDMRVVRARLEKAQEKLAELRQAM